MQNPSILLVVERETPSQLCLGRALMVARYLRARLDILLCRDRLGQALNLPWLDRELMEARNYLEAMRNSIVAPDVEIRTEIAAAGARHTAITEHARRSGSLLVIKRPWHPQPLLRERTDWELLHACPAPLLLTDGKPWRPRPRFLAAIDPMATEGSCQAIARAAAQMRAACDADLELLYMQPMQQAHRAVDGEPPAEVELGRLAKQFEVGPERVHVLAAGDGAGMREFVTAHGYDLLVLGGPAAGPMHAPHRGSSLDRALMRVACDLLVVPTASMQGATPGVAGGWASTALWHSLGAD